MHVRCHQCGAFLQAPPPNVPSITCPHCSTTNHFTTGSPAPLQPQVQAAVNQALQQHGIQAQVGFPGQHQAPAAGQPGFNPYANMPIVQGHNPGFNPAAAPAPTPPTSPKPPDPPREVNGKVIDWNTGFMLMWGGGYGGIPAIILVVMTFAMGPPWHDWIIDYRGETAQAQPYAVETTGVSVNEQSMMRVRMRFKDKAGKDQTTAIGTIDRGKISQARAQQPLTIEYDPEDPSLARFQGGYASTLNESGMLFMLPLFFVIFVIPGLGSFFIGIIRLFRRRRIYRSGTAVEATVVNVTSSMSTQNNQRLLLAHYEYATPQGRFQGKIKSLSPPMQGSRLWVVYDPKSPKVSIPA